jgi:hypothetical protein
MHQNGDWSCGDGATFSKQDAENKCRQTTASFIGTQKIF